MAQKKKFEYSKYAGFVQVLKLPNNFPVLEKFRKIEIKVF